MGSELQGGCINVGVTDLWCWSIKADPPATTASLEDGTVIPAVPEHVTSPPVTQTECAVDPRLSS